MKTLANRLIRTVTTAHRGLARFDSPMTPHASRGTAMEPVRVLPLVGPIQSHVEPGGADQRSLSGTIGRGTHRNRQDEGSIEGPFTPRSQDEGTGRSTRCGTGESGRAGSPQRPTQRSGGNGDHIDAGLRQNWAGQCFRPSGTEANAPPACRRPFSEPDESSWPG